MANDLRENLNYKAMAIFLQRIVGSFVGAAHGAAVFYGSKKSCALALQSKLLNDARDDASGFENKAAWAAVFAPRWVSRPRPSSPPRGVPSAPTPTPPGRVEALRRPAARRHRPRPAAPFHRRRVGRSWRGLRLILFTPCALAPLPAAPPSKWGAAGSAIRSAAASNERKNLMPSGARLPRVNVALRKPMSQA